MTDERKKVMTKILQRALSYEIDKQNEWRKKDIEIMEGSEEGIKEVNERRDWLIEIINEFMKENGMEYDPLAWTDYK